jgi:hypothetical protein
LALVVALLAAVWVVGPAAAAKPYVERGFVDGPHIDVIDCGAFTATLVRNFTGTNFYFVDAQDNLVRAVTNAKMVGTLTSSAGLVINLRGSVHFVFDPIKGTFTFDGQVFMANRPSVGVVLHDTGRYVSDWDNNVLFEAGPHDVQDFADPFCPVLA